MTRGAVIAGNVRLMGAALLLSWSGAGSLACSDGAGSSGEPSGSTGSPSSGAGASGASGSQGGSGASGASSGSGGDYGPGPPGCGLDAAAFCDTFDAPAGKATRAGELDPAKWSAARMCNIGGPSENGEAVGIGPATVPACRSGLPAQAFPSLDALVCDGNDKIQSAHLLTLVAAQNYGQNSYRIRQPFDFGGRTGTVVLDGEGHNIGDHGWISIAITEDPTPVPSFTLQQNFENGAIPRNGIEIQLGHNCAGGNVGIRELFVYDDYQQTSLLSFGSSCVPAAPGQLNHFEIRVASNRIEVFATPASPDGLTFGEAVQLGAADVSLPFSRGYVQLTTHNHATLKYSMGAMDAWVARWDNVGFDGPAIVGGWREYEALDSLSTAPTGKIDVGWRIADVSTGPAQVIQIHDVDLAGVVGARLALTNWSQHEPGTSLPTDFVLNYRVNEHAWKARPLTASELAMMAALPNAGTRSMMLDVDVGELVAGTNTLELTTSNAPQSWPPVALNIDLILETD